MSNNRFFASEETLRVDLDDSSWVELKRELDYGEESELEGSAIRIAGINADGTPRLDVSLRQQRSLMLALYIVGWSLAGASGQTVPLPTDLARRREVVLSLRPAWAKRLIATIEELRAAEAGPEFDSMDEPENPTRPGGGSALEMPSWSLDGSGVATRTS